MQSYYVVRLESGIYIRLCCFVLPPLLLHYIKLYFCASFRQVYLVAVWERVIRNLVCGHWYIYIYVTFRRIALNCEVISLMIIIIFSYGHMAPYDSERKQFYSVAPYTGANCRRISGVISSVWQTLPFFIIEVEGWLHLAAYIRYCFRIEHL